jgi:hypothetical protein
MRFLSIFFVLAGCGEMSNSNMAGGKRVFISSATFVGSGVTGACGRAATATHLGGIWTEWLSSAGHDAIDTVTGSGPWQRLDGQVVFADHAGLGSLAMPPLVDIDIDENGSKVVNQVNVWTGTNPLGRVDSDNDCNNWTDGTNSSFGTYGVVSSMPVQWTDKNTENCAFEARVYCFEL